MAELKIKADSGGGTVSLKGPATTTSNAAVQLTLPVDDGAANQYLKTDGSGALSWATVDTSIADDSLTEAKLDIHAAPSGTNKFLGYTSNGMEWAVPPDTNDVDYKKLATVNVPGNANTVNIDGYFTSDYDSYYIVGHGYPSSNAHFCTRVIRGGTAVSASEYVYSAWRSYNDTSNNNQLTNANVQTGDFDNPNDVINAEADAVQAAATHTSTVLMWVHRPLSTTEWKRFRLEWQFNCASNTNVHVRHGFVKNTAALSGVQFYWHDSNADMTGKFSLYGLKV